MNASTQSLIDQRPYLKDPLEFYNKFEQFLLKVNELMQKEKRNPSAAGSQAYPEKAAGEIFQLFISTFDLPEEGLEPLRIALESGDIDFMRFPLDEYPDLSLPLDQEQQESILFLLSRPFFLALREACSLEDSKWQNGRCPVCSARASLASAIEGPRRELHCSYCGTVGSYRYLGCPSCGTNDTSKLNILMPEEEPGFRISTCDDCQSYIKIVEGPILDNMTMDQADLVSLPLDIIAQERGYVRNSPNPIGLKKID